MTYSIIGHEGSVLPDTFISFGAAAVIEDGRLYNAVLKYSGRAWEDADEDERACIAPMGPFTVEGDWRDYDGLVMVDMPSEYFTQAPYAMDAVMQEIRGIVASYQGPVRSCYVFESFRMLEQWLIGMHVYARMVPYAVED